MKEKRLLILGPSFRRKNGDTNLSAFDRYDGLFYRIAKKYLSRAKDLQILVMTDDLILVKGSTLLPYVAPKGTHWSEQIETSNVETAVQKNRIFLERILTKTQFREIFIAMGQKYAFALPEMTQYGAKVVFPSTGGLGPKALALQRWLTSGQAN